MGGQTHGVSKVEQLSAEQLAYIAGFFDGEGCVHIGGRRHNSSYNLEVSASNTDKAVLDMLQLCFGGRIDTVKKTKSHYKQCYKWRAVSTQAKDFLSNIKLFLTVKKQQAEIAIAFQEAREGFGNPRRTGRSHTQNEIDRLFYDALHKSKWGQ